jgi:hypothetical protein
MDIKAFVMSKIGNGETAESHIFAAASHARIDDGAIDCAIDELLDMGVLRSTIIPISKGRTCPGLVRTQQLVLDPSRQGWIQFACSIT